MGTINEENKSNNIEPKFNEEQAYEELRMIFVIAIETQNFTDIEAQISAWESKYPLCDFIDEDIVRKIKMILNKEFLSQLLGDYLAAQVLHEKQKQQEAYTSLKQIIDTARKTKNYQEAQREIAKWKENLRENELSLSGFDRFYRSKVCSLLLIPSREIANQEEAAYELKRLKDESSSMDSETYSNELSAWQNKYCLANFPDKLKNELNDITVQVFKSIEQKRTAENAVKELSELGELENLETPLDSVSSVLAKYDYQNFDDATKQKIDDIVLKSMGIQESLLAKEDENVKDSVPAEKTVYATSVQLGAITALKDILNTTPHDTDRILNWIYTNRKINFGDFAREEIVKNFLSVGYKIPTQASYSIPEVDTSLPHKDFDKIDIIRENVIENYLGILSLGNSLSTTAKENITKIHTTSEEESVVSKNSDSSSIVLSVFDNTPKPADEEEKKYDEKGSLKDSEDITISIEDILDNPAETYSIVAPHEFSEPIIANENVLETPTEKEESEDLQTSSSSVSDKITSAVNLEEDTPVVSEVIPESKEPEEEIEGKQEQPELAKTNSSTVPASKYSLTVEDNKNLENTYNLSTYIVTVSPILNVALAKEKASTTKVQKVKPKLKDDKEDFILEKNNG